MKSQCKKVAEKQAQITQQTGSFVVAQTRSENGKRTRCSGGRFDDGRGSRPNSFSPFSNRMQISRVAHSPKKNGHIFYVIGPQKVNWVFPFCFEWVYSPFSID